MKLYIMLIKPHSSSSSCIYWSKTKGYIHDVNSAEVFDEKYIEWFKNSAYSISNMNNVCRIPLEIKLVNLLVLILRL